MRCQSSSREQRGHAMPERMCSRHGPSFVELHIPAVGIRRTSVPSFGMGHIHHRLFFPLFMSREGTSETDRSLPARHACLGGGILLQRLGYQAWERRKPVVDKHGCFDTRMS